MTSSMKVWNPLTGNNISSCSADVRSHIVQESCHINDFWLPRCIFNNGPTFGLDSSQHRVDGSTHADRIHINASAFQLLTSCG